MPRVNRRHLVDVFEHRLPDYPRGLAFSPDGRWLALGAADGTVQVLYAATGKVASTHHFPAEVSSLSFSSEGDALAIGCHDGAARLLDTSTWAQRAELPSGSRAWVEHLAWSSTGVLAVAAGKKVRLWTSSGAPVLETQPHESTITGVAFSRDGQRLFTSSYGGVRAWPLSDRAEAHHYPWKGSLISLALSPDDAVVACGSQDCSVHFWHLPRGADSEMRGYPAKPATLAWSPDAALLATGGAETICVWRFEGKGPEGTKPLLLKGHEKLVTQLSFASKERLLASAGEDRDVLLWSLADGLKPVALAPMSGAVAALRFSADDGFLAAADEQGLVRVFTPTREVRS